MLFNHFNRFFMKRSKVFLALSTTLLAISAVAATRVNHRVVSTYYVTSAVFHCQAVGTPPSGCTITVGNICKTTGNSTMFAAKTAQQGVHCTLPLQKVIGN